MKILYLIENLSSGGKERRLVELIKGLSESNNLELELVLLGSDEIHYDEIHDFDVKIYYLHSSIKKSLYKFYQLYKLISKIRPDIIHSWGHMPTVYSIPSKLAFSIPLINSSIVYGEIPKKSFRFHFYSRISFPFSDKITSNSLAGLKAHGIKENYKNSVIYNGFNFNRISNLDDKQIILNQFEIQTENVVGMIASFSIFKDHKTFIEAAMEILNYRKDVTFICVGSGDSSNYKSMISKDKQKYIRFYSSQKNIESIINCLDISVLISYSEGISNVILESISSNPLII